MRLVRLVQRVFAKKKLKKLKIKLPLSFNLYSKNTVVRAEEGVGFERVDFACELVEIGAYSYMHSGELYMVSKIGRFCSIAERVYIGLDPTGHPTHWLSTHPFQWQGKYNGERPRLEWKSERENVEIGNDVWIGQDVIIMKGVQIGHGAIIGAKSVVTKDIPNYAVAVGAPARVIKYRFSESVIKRLLESQWWDCSVKDLRSMDMDNVEKVLNQLEYKKNPSVEYKKVQATRVSKGVLFRYDK